MLVKWPVVMAMIAAVAVPPARASVEVGGASEQTLRINAVDASRNRRLMLIVRGRVGASTSGLTPSLSATFEATGYLRLCSEDNACTEASFDPQRIEPTALSFDPLGNSGTFRGSLVPSPPGLPVPFDLSFSNPQAATYCAPCVEPGFWIDPGSVDASVQGRPGITRSDYTITGTINNTPLVFDAHWSVEDSFTTELPVLFHASAP